MRKKVSFASGILSFYRDLNISTNLPEGVSFMDPFRNAESFVVTERFYHKFYNDNNTRQIILGINPGRFGGGITGIPFTDPINLELHCEIKNGFQKKPELSSTFIYLMIDAFGGPQRFYEKFFISALSPLGFMKDGRNLNYYDIPELQRAVEPFIISCITKQLALPIDTAKCYCLGEGENFRYLKKLNDRFSYFDEIIPLPHPRFIMQYKRKQLSSYIDRYVTVLNS